MQNQQPPKSYPPFQTQTTPQPQTITVQIRNEPITLSPKDFFELTQIVNLSNLPEMKSSGLHSIMYNQNNVVTFHIFLYYCIKVELGIQIQGLDRFYLRELGGLYVAGGFVIQIGKFAKMCEICLGIDVRKCAHVIYYLVYGRIATNSYIDSLVTQVNARIDKKEKLKSILSSKFLNKKESLPKAQKEKIDESKENQDYGELVEDLNKIFVKNQRQSEERETNRGWRRNDEDQEDKNNKQNHKSSQSQKKYYMNFFPNRIYNTEKSAIFESIHPGHQNHYRLMRKKKFNDEKIEKMLYMTFNVPSETEDREENAHKGSTGKQRSKIFTYSAMRTNQKFKLASNQLDKIRNTITKTKRKYQVQNQPPYTSTPALNECQKSYMQFLEKSRVSPTDMTQKVEQNELSKIENQNQNTIVSLIRRESRQNGRQKSEQSPSDYSFHRRKETTINLSTGDESAKTNRIFHTECQSRLFKYKNEYRRFMKVHLFKADSQ